MLKKAITAFLVAMSCTISAFAAEIPDHRGTSLDGFEFGTKNLNKNVIQYSELFQSAGDQYGIDPNILAAICMQESSGINYSYRSNGTAYPAWGIMQIEYTNEKAFAAFGLDRDSVAWTLEDRLDPSKAVPYAAYLLSESLYAYDYDYAKMLQSYNFGQTVLNKIIAAKGDHWLDERKNAINYVSNWSYSSYGDSLYIEHVLAYYHHDIPYVGAKVTVNGKNVRFNNQYPLIVDDRTLIPVRAVSEALGASVDWDGDNQLVTITKDNKTIKLYINQTTAYINNSPCSIDIPAEVINNRTMVPLRFVAESMNLTVNWDGATRTVEVTY